jgi:DUF438 domain-containing protein
MSEMMGNTRKEALTEILHRLHAGEGPQDLQAAFRDVVGDVSPMGIAQIKGELVYIRYFPVRGVNGEYLGAVEVTQDIGPIQKISGERRLLDN